jgi:hypothetical protein
MSYAKNTRDSGRLGTITKYSLNLSNLKNQFNIVDDKVIEIKEVIVHTFTLSDVDDPDLYAAGPIFDWERSEIGRWVMDHAVDQPIYGYKYKITARLQARDYTYWVLKWNSGS